LASGTENIVRLRPNETEDATRPAGRRLPAASIFRTREMDGGARRNVAYADVFVQGAVRHPDHATIVLPAWHRVLMNTGQRSGIV
jgi:hypothetical protein